jgi:hypothetical protein
MAKKTINLGGKALPVESIPFKVESEPWCEYQCEDGTKVRAKLVVTEIVRVEGAYTQDGDPVYSIKSNNIVATDVPDELRKQPPKPPSGGGSQSGNYV